MVGRMRSPWSSAEMDEVFGRLEDAGDLEAGFGRVV
jgi:hypothetical protein